MKASPESILFFSVFLFSLSSLVWGQFGIEIPAIALSFGAIVFSASEILQWEKAPFVYSLFSLAGSAISFLAFGIAKAIPYPQVLTFLLVGGYSSAISLALGLFFSVAIELEAFFRKG